MRHFLLFLGAILLLNSCSNDEPISSKEQAKFIRYISAFTSGTISKKSKIRIEFTSDIEGAKEMQPIEDVFDFDPSIEGQAVWINSKTIEFQPAEMLESGRRYKGAFQLAKIMQSIPEEMEIFSFSFGVMKQAYSFDVASIEPISGNKLKWQRLQGTIRTSDYATYEAVEGVLKAEQSGRDLKIKWTHNSLTYEHEFIVDSIQRKEEASKLALSFNGGSLGIEQSEEAKIDIPSIKDFSVFRIKEHSGKTAEDQYIEINFSDPLQKQRLTGLVYFDDGTKLNTTISGNTIKVYPEDRFIGDKKLIIDKSVKNILGFPLKADHIAHVRFVNYKPSVEFIGSGTIVPNSKGTHVPFKAVNLKSVYVQILQIRSANINQYFQVNGFDGTDELKRVGRVVYRGKYELNGANVVLQQWNNFSLDLDKIINMDPGAIYRVGISFRPDQSLYPCEADVAIDPDYFEEFDKKEDLYYEASQKWYYGGDFSYRGMGYEWNEKDNPCHASYYMYRNNRTYKNVFASNLGIIAKGNPQSKKYHVIVSDLTTTQPISGANVQVRDLQGETLFEGTTNSEGIFKTKKMKRIPFLVKVTNGNEVGYLKLSDGDALSQSMFDVSGEEVTEGVKGFIYGERGVWRPGDSLFLTFMLEDQLEALPENHPIVMELYTPENKLYKRIVKNSGVNGFYDFMIQTDAEDLTGNWHCEVEAGGNVFHKSLRIENIKPNRLKINYDLENEYLSRFESQKIKLTSKWLHGAKAANLKADVEMKLESKKTSFKGKEDFTFDDPSKKFRGSDKKIFDGNLNAEGSVSFNPNIRVGEDAPGMLSCKLKTRVFENGGDFSVDVRNVPFSPYKEYIGFQLPEGEGWRNALYSDQPNLINIVSVDPTGKVQGNGKVKIEVYEINWRWWWDHSNYRDLGSYIRRSSTNKILSDEATLVDGKVRYELNFEKHSWGRKFIRVTHPNGNHTAGATFFTTYSSWWNEGEKMPEGAEMLDFSLDKKSYKVGEDAFVKLPNADQGRVLVSLEKNSEIIETFWHDLEKGGALKIPVREGMAPNFYVNLTLVQPHGNIKNDAPIRMYGVQSVKVSDPKTELEPIIDMPKELGPEEIVTIKVSEKSGKEMNYTLAVVDEGLLDLTRFNTPDPFHHFYAKEALKVHTWDMYNDVLGAFTGKISGLLAIGGGDLIVGEGDKKLQRFEPMVRYFKPKNLESGETDEITFKMPNYVGSVRVMLVAGHKGAYGSTDKTVPVTKPLMVFPTVPRVIRPNEVVEIPVSVFVMDELKAAQLKISASEGAQVVGDSQQTIEFDGAGEYMVYFKIKAGANLGKAKVRIDGVAGSEKSYFEVGIPITTSTPKLYDYDAFSIEKGAVNKSTVQNLFMPGTGNFSVELSRIPSLNLEQKLNYLIGYPHGCLEQTTSKLMGQIYLTDVMSLSEQEREEISYNIKSGINKLTRMQHSSGGFGYWSSSSSAHDWGSSYAGHFLIIAKKKGYNVPDYVLSNWEQYQKRQANNWSVVEKKYYSSAAQEIEQAYRLYTLAQTGSAALGAMNRMKNQTMCEEAAWYLAGAYALVGQKATAMEIIDFEHSPNSSWNRYTFSNSITFASICLEVYAILEDWDKCAYWLETISTDMKMNSWHSTRSIGAVTRGVGTYVEMSNSDFDSDINVVININGKEIANIQKEEAIVSVPLGELKDSSIVEVKNNGERCYAVVQSSGHQLQGTEVAHENGVRMRVNYYHKDVKIAPSQIKKGMDIEAEVVVQHTGEYEYFQHLALSYVFSSAWEFRNMRMENDASNTEYDHMDIKDDRVYVYFNLGRNKTRTFRFEFNVTYGGEFYMPAASCEHMYKKKINAVVPGAWQTY